jgi:hypothetical protein
LALIVSGSHVTIYLDRPDAGGYALVVQRAHQHFGLSASNRQAATGK